MATSAWGDLGRSSSVRVAVRRDDLDHSASSATAINDRREVVGISGICDRAFGRLSAKRMVLWKKGRPIEIRNLGGVAWNTPMAINRRGHVVGFANRSSTDGAAFRPRAFLSKHPRKIEDLGALDDDPF